MRQQGHRCPLAEGYESGPTVQGAPGQTRCRTFLQSRDRVKGLHPELGKRRGGALLEKPH